MSIYFLVVVVFHLDSKKRDSKLPRRVNRPVPKGYVLNSCDPDNVDLSNVRPLTTIERSYIQTFPSEFKFSGTKTNLEQMIGNAVPVNLGTFIANAIKEYCKNGPIKTSLFDEALPFELPNRALNRQD